MLQYLPAIHMEKLTDERSCDLQIILNYIAYVQRIDDVDNRYMPIIIGRLRYLSQELIN